MYSVIYLRFTNDNSGILKYVRIEFGGVLLSANNEINGLTLGAVGSGTTIDYVQCSFINDDSFEWFGGAVNCKHLIAYRGVDDDFDTDNGYSGMSNLGEPITIGNDAFTVTNSLYGEMDVVRFWDRVLTPTEASDIATAELAGTDINP